ncbi:calcium-activated chloride channel-domain-containing protein [Zalerion maritima]|uniref:Calcium-activated chloride channel-domain-containing protein n=1 Tax=Zalerion maritima TaxID=339359 RepID=A0AAD5RW69_9PEZI|nr:calcium-activated chloride channel-domain-containing protein [Zalerion maritima]
MATLSTLYKSSKEKLEDNFGVDYVIHYEIPAKEKDEAEGAFTQLILELTNIGLATEVRAGEKSSLLVFLKAASEKYLKSHAYKARLQDWLHGVRLAAPDKDVAKYFEEEPVSEAERLRLIYLLITKPKNEGGAGISPQSGTWKYVQSVFPLHNHAFNRAWIKEWSTKYILDDSDITKIRDKFGEKVALYFAFLQAYFKFLVFPAAFGFGTWLLIGSFSWLYAIANSLWTVVFFEYWKQKEADLAVQWGVKGVSRIQHRRPEFQFDRETEDPVTGEIVKVYSPVKRLKTQLLQVPFAITCAVVLGFLISIAYSIEIFISEVYNGPGKSVLVFTPTVVLTLGVPTLSTLLTKVAHKLTDMENYETQDGKYTFYLRETSSPS